MTRRAVLVAVLAAVLIISFAGCSGGDNMALDPKKPVAITVWHYYHGAQKTAFDNAVKSFNETIGLEKGIIVEAASLGGVDELAKNVLAAARGELDAGEMPDIFGSYGDTALIIKQMDMAAKLDDYLSAEEIAEYNSDFIREGRLGTESLYVMPIAKSTESLMINKTHFDAFLSSYGSYLPDESVSYDDLATWEGILKVADIYYRYTEITSPDKTGKAFLGMDSMANYFIIGSKQLGRDIVQVNGDKVTVNTDSEIMRKLWDTYFIPSVTGRISKIGRFCSDDIKTGDILCYIGSTSSASYFPTEISVNGSVSESIEMEVLPMPVFENGDKTAVSQGAGMVVAKSEPLREYASAVFLKWFTEAERNASFSLNSGYMPVKIDALDNSLLSGALAQVPDLDDTGTVNTAKSLKTGLEQLKDYTMYSSEVFSGSADFRAQLPEIPERAAREGRAMYLALIDSGLESGAALERVSEDSGYEDWIEELARYNT